MFRILVLAVIASTAAAQDQKLAVKVPAFPNSTCPIMGKPASEALYVDTMKGRMYVCCLSCNKKILKDQEGAHRTAFPKVTEVKNERCPVTGNAIAAGAPTLTLQGHQFRLCCPKCVEPAARDSQLTLVRLLMPEVEIVGNKKCPISGEPVVANSYVLIGNSLVGLASPKSVSAVEKAPAQALEKARESAEKPKPQPATPEK